MGLGARLPGTKLTLLSHLGATSGTPDRQCLFLGDSHASIMRVFPGRKLVNFDQCSYGADFPGVRSPFPVSIRKRTGIAKSQFKGTVDGSVRAINFPGG